MSINRKKDIFADEIKRPVQVEVNLSIPSLLSKGKEFMIEFNYDKAIESFEKVLQLDENNTETMDLLSECLLEQGQIERAYELLQKSIKISPTNSYIKWFTLAELSKGQESITYYLKGIDLLKKEESTDDNRWQLSSAYCAILDVFHNELDDYDGFIEAYESYVNEGLKICNENPEIWYHGADIKLAINDIDNGLYYLKCCMKAISNLDENNVPSIEIYDKISKLCIEYKQYNLAIDLLNQMIHLDDSIFETWYLLGLCYMKNNQFNEAKISWLRTKEIINSLKQLNLITNENDYGISDKLKIINDFLTTTSSNE